MSKFSKVVKYSVLAMGLVGGYAHAADDGIVSDDGGIELAGHVYTGTCKVTVDGQDATATQRPMVTLPSILTADIPASAAIGDLLGTAQSKFIIEVSNCGNGLVPNSIAFNQGIYGVSSGTVDSYKNSSIGKGASPVATGVGAAMVKTGATKPLNFNEAVDLIPVLVDPTDPDSDFISGSVEMNTQFVKTAASVSSGAFTSVATFDIVYK